MGRIPVRISPQPVLPLCLNPIPILIPIPIPFPPSCQSDASPEPPFWNFERLWGTLLARPGADRSAAAWTEAKAVNGRVVDP